MTEGIICALDALLTLAQNTLEWLWKQFRTSFSLLIGLAKIRVVKLLHNHAG